MSVDDIDTRILERLEQDGRASLREIAQDLDLSPSTVSNRFHRLEESGIIEGFRPIIDYEAVGFGLTAIIEIEADSHRIEDVVAEMRGQDRVIASYEITGDTDLILICKFLDRQDMNAAVKEFQQIDGVTASRTKVVLDVIEENGTLDLQAALESQS